MKVGILSQMKINLRHETSNKRVKSKITKRSVLNPQEWSKTRLTPNKF